MKNLEKLIKELTNILCKEAKKKVIPPTNKQIQKVVLNVFQDMLGGDDWDDPELLDVMNGWVSLPTDWEDREEWWSKFDPEKEARELINQGFDPRSMLQYSRGQ